MMKSLADGDMMEIIDGFDVVSIPRIYVDHHSIKEVRLEDELVIR